MDKHIKNTDDTAKDKAKNRSRRLGLWLRLFMNTAQIEKQIRQRFRDELEVTLPRFDVMSALYRAPEGLTMGALSAQLLVSNGNVTGIVTRLQKEGLVDRKALPTDRRVYKVALSEKGRVAFEEMAAAHEDWIEERLGDLSAAEVEDMIGMMDRLKGALQARSLGAKT